MEVYCRITKVPHIFYGLCEERATLPTNIPPGQIAETGQITQYATYDDAYFAITPTLNVGVPWPSPRFTRIFCDSTGPCAEQLIDCDIISSNNVVTDNLTGLVWSEDANLGGLKTWENTITYTQ